MLKKLKAKRARLMKEADGLKLKDGSFADDAKRTAFDAKMAEVESVDVAIRAIETESADSPSEFIREQNPADDPADDETRGDGDEADEEPTPAEVGARTERARCQGILLACRAAKMPSAMYDKLVADGITLEAAQTRIFTELQKRVDPNPNSGPNAGARRANVEMGEDPFTHKRAGIENALMHRVNPTRFKLEEIGREYRGMSMLDVGKAYLMARGVRITGMGRMELAGAILGLSQVRGGMMGTSDFPFLLADVANKSLRAEYEAQPQTFTPIVSRGTIADFKTANRVQLGDAPPLLPINEHGEFKRGGILEGREQIVLVEYGRVFAITRKALINDDLNAFSRVPMMFGRSARNLESDIVWNQILSNPTMGDSVALFHATHANYSAAGLIALAGLNAAEVAMMKQTGLDATTLVNIQPKYLIVPPSQKMRALQFVSVNLSPALPQNTNPFAGTLQVIAEPRLELGITIGSTTTTGSAYAWYLAADPSQIDIVELATLEGQAGPVMESRIGFDVDGLEIKCRHDVGAKVLDWRGLYKNDGSDAS